MANGKDPYKDGYEDGKRDADREWFKAIIKWIVGIISAAVGYVLTVLTELGNKLS